MKSWSCPICYKSALPFADCSSIWSKSHDSSFSSSVSSTSVVGGGLSIYYANCRSLLPKINEIRGIAMNNRLDIIALTETWLDSEVFDCEVDIPSFRLLRGDRSHQGGGVALYVSESLVVKSYHSHCSLEFLSAAISTFQGVLLVGLFYRPPSSGSSLDDLESLLTGLDLLAYKSCVILGDFNIDLLKASDSLPLELLGIMSGLGLSQLVGEPTRSTASSSSLIDHVYVSGREMVHDLAVGTPLASSDHFSISFSIELPKPRPCQRAGRFGSILKLTLKA